MPGNWTFHDVITQLTLYDTCRDHEMPRADTHELLAHLFTWNPWAIEAHADQEEEERQDFQYQLGEAEAELDLANQRIQELEEACQDAEDRYGKLAADVEALFGRGCA